MKKILLSLLFALFLLPLAVMGQCGSGLSVIDADGNSYATVKVGSYCWMQSNLKTRVPGSSIYWADMYPDTTANLEIYGRLYNWYAAMNVQPGETPVVNDHGFVQGVCPEGWHLPNDVEVAQLMTNTTPALHDTHYWLVPGTNTTNYTMRPGGYYYANRNRSEDLCGNSYMWTAQSLDESSPSVVWSDCHCDHFVVDESAAGNGLSVRCVRDEEVPAAMSVTTDSANTITKNGATLYGNVTSLGTYDQVNAGFKYGTSESTLTSIVSDGVSTTAPGMFSFGITGLTANTQYYFKAFAANGTDTVYGEVKDFTTVADVFTCGTSKVKDVDNNEYNTVKIGNQCWMKENLRTTKYANGTAIANGGTTPSTTTAYRYFPGGDTNNVATYGHLYNWKAVMGSSTSSNNIPSGVQGICPDGWHVPSDAEWTQLTTYVKSVSEYVCEGCSGTDDEWNTNCIAKALSQPTGWSDTGTGCNAGNTGNKANATGFSAVPAGVFFFGDFYDFGSSAYFWSATQNDDNVNDAWCRYLYSTISHVIRYINVKDFGFSVRCLRDAEVPAAMSVTTDSANTITKNGATLYGNVTSLGTYDQVNAGFKYGTSEDALTSIVAKEDAMTATGLFSYTITDLTANTQYYFKAFAANGTDTVYGEVKNFTTLTDVVTDTIAFVPNGGQGTMDTMFVTRGDTVLNANTYTRGNWHFDGWNTAADGSGTQYADRASITTSGNLTLYAQWGTWCTGTPRANESGTYRIDSVKDVDNNQYAVVQIGNQCWMAQNLRTTQYADGTAIVKGGSAMSRVMPYRYFPDDDTNNVNTYGHLYNWMAVMNGAESSSANPSGVQGICPDGWHVPSNAEWNTLTQYVYNSDDPDYKCSSCESSGWIEATKCIGKALASTTGWDTKDISCAVGNDLSDNNATGFSAVPAGGLHASGGIAFFGQVTFFWSATYKATPNIHVRSLSYSSGNVSSSGAYDSLGLSVRCLRDPLTVTTDSANTVTNNTATLHGNVTDMGGKDNVYAGFKYGTSESALTSIASDGSAMWGTGQFNYIITGLTANTQYYFKAFAANGTDTVYGEVKNFKTMSFSCLGTPKANERGTTDAIDSVVDVDGNAYTTVQIGNQCWMKENLRTTKYANGTAIANGGTTPSTTTAYRYFPGGDTNNVATYGHLYNWKAVMGTSTSSEANPSGVQGICPEGWHVPSDAE